MGWEDGEERGRKVMGKRGAKEGGMEWIGMKRSGRREGVECGEEMERDRGSGVWGGSGEG